MATLTLIIAALLSALVSSLFLFYFSKWAARLGLIDHPNWRKVHARPTPLVGGIAICLGAIVALLFTVPFIGEAFSGLSNYCGFALGAAIMLVLGVFDDIRPVPARYKLMFQVLACCAAISIDGVTVGDFGIQLFGTHLTLGPLIVPFSILVMLTVVNGVNMLDGVDGLAGGVAFIALALMCKAAVAGHSDLSALILVTFIGALAVFLTFNFPVLKASSAKVYLGDSGALLLGFTVAYFAIRLSATPGRVFRPSTALWFFFLPVADAALLYVRRMIRNRAPFAPGRDHIHHLLMRRLSARSTTWLLVMSSGVLASLSYAGERLRVSPMAHVVLWLLAFLLYAALTQKPWRDCWTASRKAEYSGLPLNVKVEGSEFARLQLRTNRSDLNS